MTNEIKLVHCSVIISLSVPCPLPCGVNKIGCLSSCPYSNGGIFFKKKFKFLHVSDWIWAEFGQLSLIPPLDGWDFSFVQLVPCSPQWSIHVVFVRESNLEGLLGKGEKKTNIFYGGTKNISTMVGIPTAIYNILLSSPRLNIIFISQFKFLLACWCTVRKVSFQRISDQNSPQV